MGKIIDFLVNDQGIPVEKTKKLAITFKQTQNVFQNELHFVKH